MVGRYGPHNPDETYVPHGYPEQLFDTGEVRLNYATAGEASNWPVVPVGILQATCRPLTLAGVMLATGLWRKLR